jgi:hypothetical protein
LVPVALTTARQVSISFLMKPANSIGVVGAAIAALA